MSSTKRRLFLTGNNLSDCTGMVSDSRIRIQSCEKGDADEWWNVPGGKIFEMLFTKLFNITSNSLREFFAFNERVWILLFKPLIDLRKEISDISIQFC